MWMRGIRTNCLMKAHFARHDLHHVDLIGGAAPVHDVLHAAQNARWVESGLLRLPRPATPAS